MENDNLAPLKKDPDTYLIIGAAMAVHTDLGCGFLEPVYHEALGIEFQIREIRFEHEVPLPITYKGRRLSQRYRVDFKCGTVLVEVKAVDALAPIHKAQMINYLKASKQERGLVLNFGGQSLEWERVVLDYREPIIVDPRKS